MNTVYQILGVWRADASEVSEESLIRGLLKRIGGGQGKGYDEIPQH